MSDSEGPWLDSEEFEDLERFLAENPAEDGLDLDSSHGLITAVLVGPEAIGEDEWVAVILGEEHAFEDPAQAQRILDLLLRLKGSVAIALERCLFEPMFRELIDDDGSIEVDTSGWCEGFSIGVDLRGPRWEQQMRADGRLLDLIAPILTLGVDDGAFQEIADTEIAPLSEREREALRQRIPSAVIDLAHYWRDLRDGSLEPAAEADLSFEPEDRAEEAEPPPPPRRLH